MALPMVDLSRWVLLVPVEDEAGGQRDLELRVLLLESVDVVSGICGLGVVSSEDDGWEDDSETKDVDAAGADGGDDLSRGIGDRREETEADILGRPNSLSYWLTEGVREEEEGATAGEGARAGGGECARELLAEGSLDAGAVILGVRDGARPML